jgi:hypothetical protein
MQFYKICYWYCPNNIQHGNIFPAIIFTDTSISMCNLQILILLISKGKLQNLRCSIYEVAEKGLPLSIFSFTKIIIDIVQWTCKMETFFQSLHLPMSQFLHVISKFCNYSFQMVKCRTLDVLFMKLLKRACH